MTIRSTCSPKPRTPDATAVHEIPGRQPDTVVEEQTSPNQAALYRLNGDDNPLHIDTEFAGIGGFPQPILHGLCTFGVAAKQVLKTFGDGNPAAVKSIKVRVSCIFTVLSALQGCRLLKEG